MALFLAVLLVAVSVPYTFAASLNYTSKSIYYGKTLKLKADSGTAYGWSSSKPDVATVSESGKVKGVGLGTAVITAKVGGQTVSCKVKVKDRDVTAAVSFKSSTGGAFINKVNEAVIGVKPLKYSAAKATVYVKDAAGTVVYKTTLTNLTKNQGVYSHWNGKNNKGAVVPNGTYTVYVKIGKQVSKSNVLAFLNKNYFAAGDGSAKNPFQVATVDQLKQIVRYPNACFKQTKNLDCGYESVGGFFTEDLPFNGVYDGNGKTISNISATKALLTVIGEKGQIKKLNMKGCSIAGNNGAVLARSNYGKIVDCSIDGTVSVTLDYTVAYVGIICINNYGTINNCKSSGAVSTSAWEYTHAAGLATLNLESGKIINCETDVSTYAKTTSLGYARPGGVASINKGLINNCIAKGTVVTESDNQRVAGGIAAENEGQIINCIYLGSSNVQIAGKNVGVIA